MVILPNLEHAVIPLDKLEDYVLNPNHLEGMHKAKLFRELLGVERRHALALAELIKHTLPRAVAERGKIDEYGERWATYHEIIGLNGATVIVTVAWILRVDAASEPVLISCYIDSDHQEKLRTLHFSD